MLFIDDDRDNLDALLLCCEDKWDIQLLDQPGDLVGGRLPLESFDVLFLDLVLYRVRDDEIDLTDPDPSSGFEVLEWMKGNAKNKPIVVISAALTEASIRYSLETGYPNVLWFPKPVDFTEEAFQRLIERYADKGA